MSEHVSYRLCLFTQCFLTKRSFEVILIMNIATTPFRLLFIVRLNLPVGIRHFNRLKFNGLGLRDFNRFFSDDLDVTVGFRRLLSFL